MNSSKRWSLDEYLHDVTIVFGIPLIAYGLLCFAGWGILLDGFHENMPLYRKTSHDQHFWQIALGLFFVSVLLAGRITVIIWKWEEAFGIEHTSLLVKRTCGLMFCWTDCLSDLCMALVRTLYRPIQHAWSSISMSLRRKRRRFRIRLLWLMRRMRTRFRNRHIRTHIPAPVRIPVPQAAMASAATRSTPERIVHVMSEVMNPSAADVEQRYAPVATHKRQRTRQRSRSTRDLIEILRLQIMLQRQEIELLQLSAA